MEMMKCPFCGNQTFSNIQPAAGTGFVLTCVDQNATPPSFLATTGIAVNALGCSSCKAVQLVCPSLKPNN